MTQEKPIYDLIEEEHAQVLDLSDKVRAASDPEERSTLLEMLTRRLQALVRAKRASLFEALDRYEEPRSLIEESELEHEQLGVLAEQAQRATALRQPATSAVEALHELLHDHIEQQNGELIPFARGVLGTSEAVYLGRLFEEESERWLE